MASVYYLFDDALQVAGDIIEKYSQQDKNLKENHYAATIVQRTYRKYVARKLYKKTIDAAIVLQKYIRGWLIRYHFPDFLHESWDVRCLKRYNWAATKIQACWKGTLVRQEIDIKKIIEKRLMAASDYRLLLEMELSEASMRDFGTEVPTSTSAPHLDNGIPYGGVPLGHEIGIKQRILQLMYNRHHLLSTKQRQGVLACNQELQEVEKVLRAISWKAYMKKVKKLSYKYQILESDAKKSTYMFKNKQMRKQEDLLRLRNKSGDIKEVYFGNCVTDNRKRFDLYSKLDRPPYERSIIYQEPYRKSLTNLGKSEHPSRNISQTDFIFALKEIVKECKIPTYYADFWYKECIGHNFID